MFKYMPLALLILGLVQAASHADPKPVVIPANLPPPSAMSANNSETPVSGGQSDMGVHMLIDEFTNFPGAAVSYNQVVDPQWTLGGSLWSMRTQAAYSEGGSLDNAQYYAQYIDMQSFGLEGNAAFYFRQNGVHRWGALIRMGLGYAVRTGTAHWTREDRDPGFFTFGNNRSLDSGQGDDVNMSSFYSRLGLHYQFVFGKRALAAGHGHILEFGVTSLIPFQRKTATFTKPTTGESVSIRAPALEPALDISYRIIF